MIKKTIRRGDDFKAIISLTDREGISIDATTAQFKFIYRDVYNNGYEVSYDGIKRVNNYVDGDHLVAVFENYKLACGVLNREAWYWVADPAFTDGRWNYGDTRSSSIELTEQGGAKEVNEIVEVPSGISVNETLAISKGDKGDPFIYSDFTPEQLAALKGEPFVYEDFTPDQLEALRGNTGAKGDTPYIVDGWWWISGTNTGVKAKGVNGANFTPSVDAEGNLSWTNDGGLPNPPTQNIKGNTGATGPDGKIGKTGETGKNAYQLAVEGGYAGTEAQFKTEQANVANNSARLTSVEQNKQDKPLAGRSFLTPLFVARGAVFNQTTGFYELNGLTDITEEQMIEIYYRSMGLLGGNWSSAFYLSTARTAFTKKALNSLVNATECFRDSSVEILNFTFKVGISDISPQIENAYLMFHSCKLLKKINGYINCTVLTNTLNMFTVCPILEDVLLRSLKISLSFANSPLLTRDSILYLITNATNTAPITVTLHADAKARLTEADIALASSKNITIA